MGDHGFYEENWDRDGGGIVASQVWIGAEPPNDGDVIRCAKKYAGRRYDYALIRHANHWYSTGRNTSPMVWAELVKWLSDGVDFFEVIHAYESGWLSEVRRRPREIVERRVLEYRYRDTGIESAEERMAHQRAKDQTYYADAGVTVTAVSRKVVS